MVASLLSLGVNVCDVYGFLDPVDQFELVSACRTMATFFDRASTEGYTLYHRRLTCLHTLRLRDDSADEDAADTENNACLRPHTSTLPFHPRCVNSPAVADAIANACPLCPLTAVVDMRYFTFDPYHPKTVVTSEMLRACEFEGVPAAPVVPAVPEPPRARKRLRPYDAAATRPKSPAAAIPHLVVSGLLHITAIEDGFLSKVRATRVSFEGSAPFLRTIGADFLSSADAVLEVSFGDTLQNVTQIGEYWLYDCNSLDKVRFGGLKSLQTVGGSWLAGCCQAPFSVLDFEGLGALEEVADRWLFQCWALQRVAFDGLGALKKVGDMWLACCSALESVDFKALSSLLSVDDSWLSSCAALQKVAFTNMKALQSVGMSWMRECSALTDIDFSDLCAVESVSMDWLHECHALVTVSFKGMRSLKHVGYYWMGGLAKLEHVDFEGLDSLETVDHWWLWSCKALKSINFKGLNKLRRVGGEWLAYCYKLEFADFSGLPSLASVDFAWMRKCAALQWVCFDNMTSLKRVGITWMKGCNAIEAVDFSPLTNLESVLEAWLLRCTVLRRVSFKGMTKLRTVGSGWMVECPLLKAQFQGGQDASGGRVEWAWCDGQGLDPSVLQCCTDSFERADEPAWNSDTDETGGAFKDESSEEES